jgi:hypothetical protein
MMTLKFFVALAITLLAACSAFQTTTCSSALRRPAVAFSRRFEHSSPLKMAESDDFWSQQKALLEEMTTTEDKIERSEQSTKFAARQAGLVGDTAFFSAIIFSILWGASVNPFVPISYSLGAVLGLAYCYGLGRSVESVGASIDDAGAVQGAGVGSARFAFLILLLVVVGKFRSAGLIEIPAIMGFFTYQLGSLSQGVKEIND